MGDDVVLLHLAVHVGIAVDVVNLQTCRNALALVGTGNGDAGDAELDSAFDITVVDEVGDDFLDLDGGNGEAHALIAGSGNLGGVDADDLAVHIDQRTAGIAGIDGGVGLDIAHGAGGFGVFGVDDSVHAGDNAQRDRAGELSAAGIADGHDIVAQHKLAAVAQLALGKSCRVDFEHGEVRLHVVADDLCVIGLTVAGDDRNVVLAAVADDVGIGDDVSV